MTPLPVPGDSLETGGVGSVGKLNPLFYFSVSEAALVENNGFIGGNTMVTLGLFSY